MSLTVEAVTEVLKTVVDPNTGKDFVSTRALRGLAIDGGAVRFGLELGYPAKREAEMIRRLLEEALRAALPEMTTAEIEVSVKIVPHAVQHGVKLLPGVKNIIAVASGKGGVGKSTTAANIALALVAEGAKVGMLDADIYGPSVPRMLGVDGQRPSSVDGRLMTPIEAHGMWVNSIGLLADADTPMVWRGPMATQALTQLLRETDWRDLDYLVIDLPPGTGDIQLTLAQNAPLTGAVIVTTPQDLALIDARKAIRMFEKVKIPVLGVVENMSIHVCTRCGHEEHIFGAGGGRKLCADYGVAFLGALPLELRIREETDGGTPTVAAAPGSQAAAIYREIARKVAAAIAARARDMTHKFPGIVVQHG
jgi:ATP-binding protein involved in chromosome partitioning